MKKIYDAPEFEVDKFRLESVFTDASSILADGNEFVAEGENGEFDF